MNVRNCRKCGRIFNYVAGNILCPRCREEMEKKFQEVKSYIRENPGVGVQDVSEACDVDRNQIYQWLREERLELAEGSMITLTCESCGKPIYSGKYCENCKRTLAMDMRQAISKPRTEEPERKKFTPDASSRMRYLERDKEI